MILSCRCSHSFQDAVHGFHQRVHNILQDVREARCTVCGNKRSSGLKGKGQKKEKTDG